MTPDRFNPKRNPEINHWHPEMLAKVGGGSYDGSGSGLAADTLRDAIDELAALIAAIGTGFIQTTGGGGEQVETHAAAGSAETIDLADGNIHIVPLNDDCTFTFTGYAALDGLSWVVILDQDGTGGHATTWPAAVEGAAGLSAALDDTASTRQIVAFFSPDGGTTIYWTIFGAATGGGVTDHGALTGLSDDDHPQYATNTEFDDHSARHENGGADEVSVAGLSGTLADPQTPSAHASSHQNGGGDEVSVAGLFGELADPQPPKAHAASHSDSGSDEVDVTDLAGFPGGTSTFLRADGTFATPPGSGGDPSTDTQVWMPLTTRVGGVLTLVADGDDGGLIPTLVAI